MHEQNLGTYKLNEANSCLVNEKKKLEIWGFTHGISQIGGIAL